METKFNLQLGSEYTPNELSSSIITTLTCEYLIDLLESIIKKYNKECDMTKFMDEFSVIIDKSNDVSFTNINSWIENKSDAYNELLKFALGIDEYVTECGKANENEVVTDLQTKLNSFMISLAPIKIDSESLDIDNVTIKPEYIDATIEQLRLVDEGVILAKLSGMQLELTPLDIDRNKNVFIEEKLNKIGEIASSCEMIFDNDKCKLQTQILNMYKKFYKIAYASLTDGEKAEQARKVVKAINPHKRVLDKLEDKLTDANELKRQLTIHEKRLKSGLQVQKENTERRIAESPADEEIFERELDGATFVTERYFEDIKEAIKRVNLIEAKISEHYKILDQLEIALKSAIPTEDDMKKYSSIGFKFQDLGVRLELSKSQIKKDDKEMLETVITAVSGLSTMITYSTDIKDLFMRNAMVTAIFRAVTALNEFKNSQNKSIALSQNKFVADKLNKYNDLFTSFSSDILTYRRVCNNTIRDVSIIMGKPMNIQGVFEIIDTLDIAIKQIKHLSEDLDKNNNDQIETLTSILER